MNELATTPKKSGRWKRLGCGLFLLAVVSVVLSITLVPDRILPAVAQFLDCSDPVQKTDAVLILGGEPGIRPFYAAALYRQGYANRLLITTIRKSGDVAEGLVPSGEELTASALEAVGVPADAVEILPGEVDSTVEELARLREYLHAHPDQTATILTNTYHTRRTRMLAGRILGDTLARVRFLGVPAERFNDHNWWKSKTGFYNYVREYCKVLYYSWKKIAVIFLFVVVLNIAILWIRRTRRNVSDSQIIAV